MVDSSTKQRIEYLFPPFTLDIARFCRAYFGYHRFQADLKENLIWRNAYKGEKVYVLGSGPSLNTVDRSLFAGQRVIVMNAFDRATWKGEVKIVAHCIGEPRQAPSWGNHIVSSINGTNSASYWLHFSSKGALSGVVPGKRLHHVFPCVEPGLWKNSKLIELHGSTLGYVTTAQLAIQVALYMGFKDIILLGFDHDWLATPDYSRHFYSSERDASDILHTLSYHKIITFVLRMWEIYYALRSAAEAHGATIRNMTPNSYLDVFDRERLDQQM